MTEAAVRRVHDSGRAAAEAARAALVPRIRRADLQALAEFLRLGGIDVRSIEWADAPR